MSLPNLWEVINIYFSFTDPTIFVLRFEEFYPVKLQIKLFLRNLLKLLESEEKNCSNTSKPNL